jgi:hypothetical protein
MLSYSATYRVCGTALFETLWAEAFELRMDTLIVWPSGRSVPLYQRAGYREPDEVLELSVEPSKPGDVS